jgi:cytochrome c oxidase subunit IV
MSHDDHKPDVKLYLKIFGALLVLTVVTVGLSYLNLPKGPGIAIGLLVAFVKAGLVAMYFMHLKGEKLLIWAALGVTVFFMLHLMSLPWIDHMAIQDKLVHVQPAPSDAAGGAH